MEIKTNKPKSNFARVTNALVCMAFLAMAAVAVPPVQAAVQMDVNPAAADVLINQPDAGADVIDISGRKLVTKMTKKMLIDLILHSYGCAGWQAGRLWALRTHGQDVGNGPCKKIGPIYY